MSKEQPDVQRVRELATSAGGLGDDDRRRQWWPVLLRCAPGARPSTPAPQSWESLPKHRDEDQVRLDVDRSFVFYPSHDTPQQLDHWRRELLEVITAVLRRHPMLCYFQGFHDIVQVFLLVLGKDLCLSAVEHLALLRIRDFMLPSLSPSVAHLQLLPAILYASDPQLYRHLSGTQPFFALAATLTLYAHDIEDYADIARLFDFLLAHEAAVSVYLFAVIILSRKDELLEIPFSEPEMLHFTLSKLPRPLNIESYILETIKLFKIYPPESLPFRAWSKVSRFSVLRTTRESTSNSRLCPIAAGCPSAGTLEEGESLFAAHVAQLDAEERRRRAVATLNRYRRPIGSVTLAIAIGLISYYGQRSGYGPRLTTSFSSWLKLLQGRVLGKL